MGDRVAVWVLGIGEIQNLAATVDAGGWLELPHAGRIAAAGKTVAEVKAAIAERMKALLLEPEVTFQVTEYHSQPVSVSGAVNRPGVHQLQGRERRLVEIIASAEGARPDASNIVRITRQIEQGDLPVEGAKRDASGRYSVAEVNLKEAQQGLRPEANIVLKPNDVVAVAKASTVFVIGEVRKPGGFVLENRKTLSVLEALGLAEGLNRFAAPHKAKILRASAEGARTSEAVDLKQILAGKSGDVALGENDILLIPDSKGKAAAYKTLESVLGVASGITTWRVGLPR